MSKTEYRHEMVIYGTVLDYEDLPMGTDSQDVWTSLLAAVLPAIEEAAEKAFTEWMQAHPDQLAARPGMV